MVSKDRLIKLYIKKKFSVPQISKKICKSEGEINYWIKKYNIQKRTISEAVYTRHNPNGNPFKIASFVKNKSIYLDREFIYGLGLGLYWGEGNKKNKNSVRLGNVDPKLILKFMIFLDKIFCVNKSKLKFGLQIFTDINEKESINFWKRNLGINDSQFYKTTITKSRSLGTYRQKSNYGVLTVHFHNTKLQKIMIEEIAKL